MNEMSISYSREIAVAALVLSFTAVAVLLHIAFFAAKYRRGASARYLPYARKWILCRGSLISLLLSLLLFLFAVIPATFLAWYRTHWFQRMSDRRLLLRIHDLESIPANSGGSRFVFKTRHSTTNAREIAELLVSIRFSPTYPNFGCLCQGGSRKFELVTANRYGHEHSVATFTVPHDESIRFRHDWYGDWHLTASSQRDLAAWQKRYVDTVPVVTNLVDAIPTGQTDFLPASNMTYRLSAPGDAPAPAAMRASITTLVAREFVSRTRLRERFTEEPGSVNNSLAIHPAKDNGDELHVIVSLPDDHVAVRYWIRTEQCLAAEQERREGREQKPRRRSRRDLRKMDPAPEEGESNIRLEPSS